MPVISEETAELLVKLGALDSDLSVAPEAYVAAIARLPVNKQSELLGLPIIYRPLRKIGGSPEKQFINYFEPRIDMSIDGGESYSSEGYIIKQFLDLIIREFDCRTRKHDFSNEEIEKQISHILTLEDGDIVKACEPFLNYLDQGDLAPIYPDFDTSSVDIDNVFLANRFRFRELREHWTRKIPDKKRIREAQSQRKENVYVGYILSRIELWHSLSKEEWHSLARTTLQNWEKMYVGWPDLTFYSRNCGLTLVEIKGKDKIHPTQVYTLLKLKEVLGPKRMAIGWLNSGKINHSGEVLNAHMDEVIEWFNSNWADRKPFKQKIYKL